MTFSFTFVLSYFSLFGFENFCKFSIENPTYISYDIRSKISNIVYNIKFHTIISYTTKSHYILIVYNIIVWNSEKWKKILF